MKAPKVLMLILFCLMATMLDFTLWAQEPGPIKKFYCPDCGLANFATHKFCGVCDAKLPAPALTANLFTSAGSTLKPFNPELDFGSEAATEALAGAGLLAGAIGFFAGGFVGAEIDQAGSDGYEEWDGLYGFVVGAPIGEVLLLPVGVHLANNRRGNLPLSLLTSIGIAGAGIFVAIAAEEPYALLTIPILQLTACTAIERSTGRPR